MTVVETVKMSRYTLWLKNSVIWSFSRELRTPSLISLPSYRCTRRGLHHRRSNRYLPRAKVSSGNEKLTTGMFYRKRNSEGARAEFSSKLIEEEFSSPRQKSYFVHPEPPKSATETSREIIVQTTIVHLIQMEDGLICIWLLIFWNLFVFCLEHRKLKNVFL